MGHRQPHYVEDTVAARRRTLGAQRVVAAIALLGTGYLALHVLAAAVSRLAQPRAAHSTVQEVR